MAPTKPDHSKKLKELFNVCDKDGSGSMDKSEMKGLLKNLLGVEPPQQLVDKIIQEADKDGSGKIEFKEFEGCMQCIAVVIMIIQLRMAFEELDKDKSGKLDKKELQELCKCVDSAKHADEIMSKLDTDGDGKVSFDEFCTALLATA